MSDSKNRFVDFVRLHVKAGDGGDGVVAFLREKYKPFGGPAGGDGGRGGSIILEADAEMVTLLDFRMKSSWTAPRGHDGGGSNMSGRSGKDVLVRVPLGTLVTDADTEKEIGDLTVHGQQLIVAQGGHGGRGNQHYATPTNRAPRKATPGGEGEERNILLELKVIADAGFVGLPNAGKSTLLQALTSANPKIAPYPFTTLSPNLGVFQTTDFKQRITLADIPGLIEGAHTGAGLGDRFLRHIERTKVLVHLVAPEGGSDADGEMTMADATPETLLYAFDLVSFELAEYSELLLQKPRIVCLTKTDLLSPEDTEAAVAAFKARDVELIPISSEDGNGIERLRHLIEEQVLLLRRDNSVEIVNAVPEEGDPFSEEDDQ